MDEMGLPNGEESPLHEEQPEGDVMTPAVAEPPESRRSAVRVAIAIGVAGMIAAGLFVASSLISTGSGGATPVAAVERLFDALEQEDVIGVLESLLPAERRMIQGRIQELTKELSRLGIFGERADLANVNGLELEFFGVRLAQEELSPGISAVVIREGRVRSRFDPSGGLLGDFVTGLLDEDASVAATGSADLAKNKVVVATVRDGDQWYVSIGYTVAENVRRAAGRVAPTFGQGVAIGAATPEKAVDDLIRAAAGLDVSRLIQLMPPGEARALHDYVQLFVSQVGSAAHEARGFFSAKITKLDLSSETDGETSIVKVDKLGFVYEIPDIGITIEYDGECTVLRFEGEPPERDCGTGIGPTLPFFLPLDELPDPDLGFVVVREGDEWFVSPTRTLLDGALSLLKALNPGDLDSIREFFEFGSQIEPPALEPRATPTA